MRRDTIRWCGRPTWWWYLWAAAVTAGLSVAFFYGVLELPRWVLG